MRWYFQKSNYPEFFLQNLCLTLSLHTWSAMLEFIDSSLTTPYRCNLLIIFSPVLDFTKERYLCRIDFLLNTVSMFHEPQVFWIFSMSPWRKVDNVATLSPSPSSFSWSWCWCHIYLLVGILKCNADHFELVCVLVATYIFCSML